MVATHLPDSVKTHFFGRAYMKISPGLGTTHDPLIFAGEPGWPISKFEEIGAYRGDWMPSYQENKSPAGQGRGEVTYRSDTAPPFDNWFLVEWEFNDAPASISIWIDGQRLTDTMNGEKVDMVKFTWPKRKHHGYRARGRRQGIWLRRSCLGSTSTGLRCLLRRHRHRH